MTETNAASKAWRTRLQDRDRELIAHLAVTRYLSTEQIARLMFPGRHTSVTRKRLRKLEGGEGTAAYVRRLTWRTFEGVPQFAWSLADAGFVYASQMLGAVRVPVNDVSAQFMEHTLATNELYVRLLTANLSARPGVRPGKGKLGLSPVARVAPYASISRARFRWVASDGAELPWAEYDQRAGKEFDRVIRPDAVLEVPSHRRRLFIECEMGTQTVVARRDDKPGATLHKLERYAAFVNRFADSTKGLTFYARRYPDQFQPQLILLVQTAHRAEFIKRAIDAWRRSGELGALRVRIDVIDSLVAHLLPDLGVTPEAPQPDRPLRARRSLSDEQFAQLQAFCSAAVTTIKSVRDRARAQNEPPPAYPPHAQAVLDFFNRVQTDSSG